MDIYSRFKALPRARKGTTRVVIVEEDVLEKLLVDAQAAESAMVVGSPPRGLAITSLNITAPAPALLVSAADAIERTRRARREGRY